MAAHIQVRRLGAGDARLARATFGMMAEAFDEVPGWLPDAYLHGLLAQPSFWAFVALAAPTSRFDGDTPVGGLTAHTLPMTRSASAELFIYDLAVAPAHQRRGVGRALVGAARRAAAADGIGVAFVPADDEDEHALAFYRALGGTPAPVTVFTFG